MCSKKILEADPTRVVVRLSRGTSNRSKALADLCHACCATVVSFITEGKRGRKANLRVDAPATAVPEPRRNGKAKAAAAG
jgi:hypothetical protein